MHEMGIAQSVMEAAQATLDKHPGATVARIGLRIGELAGIDRESLSFCFSCIQTGTVFERAKLEIEWLPLMHRCVACGREFEVRNFEPVCPACGGTETRFAGGDELEVAWLELEEA